MGKVTTVIRFYWSFAASLVLLADVPAIAQSGNVLEKYEALRGQEREQRLVEGREKRR